MKSLWNLKDKSRVISAVIGLGLLVTMLPGSVPAATIRVAASEKPVIIQISTDTLWTLTLGNQRPWSLQELHDPDTTYIRPMDTMIFLAGGDTVIVTVADGPVTLLIKSPGYVIHECLLPKIEQPDTARYALLRKYAQFGTTGPKSFPGFQYADPSDSVQRAFRQTYRLDSIAGTGDDISRVIRLMSWLHGAVRWDGSKENPQAQTSREMLRICITDGQTANCGGMAGMLKSLYTAMGYSSRQLVCRPYDKADQDCHSVVMVYLPQTQNWVLIDPTNEVYFRNTNGDYLSPQQIRRAMVSGDSLVLPDRINVNGVPESRTMYLNYMAKNLFRFACWVMTKSNDPARPDRWYQIFLNPSEYDAQLLGTADSTSTGGDISVYTDDESLFWSKP